MPPCPHAVAVLPPLPHALRNGAGRRQPPAYSVAAQMARLHRLGRAHSHEGVTQGYLYHTDPDTDQDDLTLGDVLTDSSSDSDTLIVMV
ncbi:hypothetical protein BDFB_012635 [Asbolus verrucosus]|uniref:Uncharacterized protein n=1 Tax=Asbolus verrucosus TaxID=1661398 RepID=A0A482VL49_ASBVE|nr:hypothetical protein BDFB_012635 [Asbolus verrucosus]